MNYESIDKSFKLETSLKEPVVLTVDTFRKYPNVGKIGKVDLTKHHFVYIILMQKILGNMHLSNSSALF